MHLQGAKAPKKTKAPEINAEEMKRICGRAKSLSRDFFPVGGQTAIVIDNELYITLKGDKVQGNDWVWMRDITTCPP